MCAGTLSYTVDFETQRAVVTGNVDPVDVLRRVRKSGKLANLIRKPPPPPAPEPEPPKEEPKPEEKKEEPKKEEPKKEEPKPEEKKEEPKPEEKKEESKKEVNLFYSLCCEVPTFIVQVSHKCTISELKTLS